MASALKINSISKQFPGVKALDNVSFEIEEGTVHALLGENGAGKSTLIKIISGKYAADAGSIEAFGKKINFTSPGDAKLAGISVVHQEIQLVDTLTVAENIFLGKLESKGFFVDWKGMRQKASELLNELGITIDVDKTVSELTIAERQLVEICKTLTDNARIVIMDEPTATITDKEVGILFDSIRAMKERGITIIYISHRLEEIYEIADSLTVLRDGQYIATHPVAETTKQQLVSLMVGRELNDSFEKTNVEIGETIMEVKGLSSKSKLNNINFFLRKGEILGFFGLVGSGRTELMRAVLGVDDYQSGTVTVFGKEVKYKKFGEAAEEGIAFVTEDRKKQGLILGMSVEENITICSLNKLKKMGLINAKKQKELATELIERLHIATPSLETEAKNLSGGNQQKICIAKWLAVNADIYIVDEPTRGIDVGAKQEIYRILNELVSDGKSVIVISSEMPELISLSDRIYVMHEGNIKGVLDKQEFAQETILKLALT